MPGSSVSFQRVSPAGRQECGVFNTADNSDFKGKKVDTRLKMGFGTEGFGKRRRKD